MLVNSNDILYMAKNGLFGIGEFYAPDPETARLIIDTALKCNMPVIIGVSKDKMREDISFEDLTQAVTEAASASFIPVVTQFESVDIDECLKALDAGYTSVRLDNSLLPFETNIKNTAYLTKEAHKHGATCESQSGVIPRAEETDPRSIQDHYTDIETALGFVKETDTDVLSVCAGNAPGEFPYRPFLNVNKVIELASGLPLPLSMHGTSGLHAFDLLHAVGNGISALSCWNDIKDPKPVDDPGQTDSEYIHASLDDITDPTQRAIATRIVLYQNR